MHITVFGLVAVTLSITVTLTSGTWTYEGTTVTLALVNYTYRDPRRDGVLVEVGQVGKYAPGQVASASGRVVVGDLAGKASEMNAVLKGCEFPWSTASTAPSGTWVALIRRGGGCPDEEKIEIAAKYNASAVILYTKDEHAHLRKLTVHKDGLAVVWLAEEEGRGLAQVVEGGAEVVLTMVPGHNLRYHVTSVNRTSVLFVSVSFIILMAISLAWLIFYYVQRFRYIHAKDRLARHLCNAAKKALAKIPVKTLKATDREVCSEGECCAVCIEHYQTGEAVRTLPCKHLFHRCCVDPWLLEHRTCPMCKMDILKHYGYVLSESEESVLQFDLGDGGESLGGDFGGQGLGDAAPHPHGPHTPRAAPHLTPVVMVTRDEGRGRGRRMSGEWEGEGRGERGYPDPLPRTHTSPSLSLQSSPSKDFIVTSADLAPSPPTEGFEDTPPHSPQPRKDSSSGGGGGGGAVEVSSVCSVPSVSLPGTVEGGESIQEGYSPLPSPPTSPEEAPPAPVTPPRRHRRAGVCDTSHRDTLDTPSSLRPASHIVSVSHF